MSSHVIDNFRENMAPWTIGDADQSARSVKSAERTLAVFELFSLQQRPLTVGQISQMLRVPQPSVSMLLRNLVKLGYIEHHNPTRTYSPTVRIMLLGSWIHRRFGLEKDIEARLEGLFRQINESVILGIENGIYSQYVLAQLPDKPCRLEVQSGLLRPITCTAIGRVFLSAKSDAEIDLLVRRSNAEINDERLRVNPVDFKKVIQKIRQNGYAETSGEMTPGSGVIAFLLPSLIGSIPMAVGIGASLSVLAAKRDVILTALREFLDGFRTSPS